MVRSFIGYTEQAQTTSENIAKRRRENAEAWKAFTDNAAKEGRAVSAEELDRYRMTLTGGDSYFMSALPSREMLSDIAKRTNQRVADTILTEATKNAQNEVTIYDSGAKFIPIDADEEGAKKSIIEAFGEEAGSQWWAKHGNQWHNIQDSKVNEQVSTLMTQPRFQQVQRPEDIDVMYPQTSPRVKLALREAVSNRLANERKGNLKTFMTAVSSFQDPNLPFMNESAILKQIDALATANGIVLTEQEGLLAMETLMNRQAAIKIADTTQRTRALHGDLTKQDSPLWQMLEGTDGANLSETTILEAINSVAGRHGFRFANVQEATEVLGEDFFTLSQKIRAGIEHQRRVAEVQTRSTERAEQIVKDNSSKLAMAVNAAVSRKDIAENGTVFMAVKSLADGGFVFTESPDTVVKFAKDYQKRTGTNDFTEIKNATIEALGGQSLSQVRNSLSAEALLSAGIGPAPGESATTFLDAFHERMGRNTGKLYDYLRSLPQDARTNGVWNGQTQSRIVRYRSQLESDIRTLRYQLSGVAKANFREFGVNQSITYNGRNLSVDEYINTRLQEAEARLAEFDRQVNRIMPEGSAPAATTNLPQTTTGQAFEQQDGETRFGAWRRRNRAQNDAATQLGRITDPLYSGTSLQSYFTWSPQDYRDHGFANAQEMERFRDIVTSGPGRADPKLVEFLAANPDMLARLNETPKAQQPQVLLQIMRQVYPTRDDLNFLGGQNAPAQQPGRP